MVLNEYENIKQSVILCVSAHHNPEEVVTKLKNIFENDINSVRTLDRIKTIEYLLYVLETRDIISEDNISRLKYDIAPFLHCRDIISRKLLNYNQVYHLYNQLNKSYRGVSFVQPVEQISWTNVPEGSIHCYLLYFPAATQPSLDDRTQSLNKTFMTFKQNNFMSEKKIERINNAIINHIGTHWKDLARNLRIQEGKIDEIEINSQSSREKAIEVLKEYESIADPQKWVFVLCEALNKSRRRDISKNIMEIFTMNI